MCQWLRQGLLGLAEDVSASRTANGPFEPLASFPEFQAAAPVRPPSAALPPRAPEAPAPSRSRGREWVAWVISFALAVGSALVAGHYLFQSR
jgi:hypothetical protein